MFPSRGCAVLARSGVVGVAIVALCAGIARAEEEPEPGVAAVASARAAIAALSSVAAAPGAHGNTLGRALLDFAGTEALPAESKTSALDRLAQGYLAPLEPRLGELRHRILDRRHFLVTGKDLPLAGDVKKPATALQAF